MKCVIFQMIFLFCLIGCGKAENDDSSESCLGEGGSSVFSSSSTGSEGGEGGHWRNPVIIDQCQVDEDCFGKFKKKTCFTTRCEINFESRARLCVQVPTSGEKPIGITTGFCRSLICDNLGNVIVALDPYNPQSDNNDCTSDVCNGIVTQHSPIPNCQ